MAVMYGADAEELEQIAAELDGYERELGQLLLEGVGAVSLVGLSATLKTIWMGNRASEFAGIWEARHLLRVREVQAMLKEAAGDLRRNASEQREASGLGGTGGGLVPGSPAYERFVREFEEQFTTLLSRLGLGAEVIDAILTNGIEGLFKGGSPIGEVLGDFGIALDIYQWGDSVFEYGFWDGRSLIELVDGVGGAVSGKVAGPIGAVAWTVAFDGTNWVLDWVDDRFDTSGAFIDSVIAREGEVPNYEGPLGLPRFIIDGFENALFGWN